MSKDLSVCIATYDRDPAVLDKVLSSITKQTPSFSFEVIVVDDGSPSRSEIEDVCEGHEVVFERIERKPTRRNPCVARNLAYRKATGKTLVPQSDDVEHITPNSLEILSNELVNGTFVIANVKGCGPNGLPWSEYSGPKRKVPYFFLGALYREDLYAVGGNDEDFRDIPGCEDRWFAECLVNGLGLKPRWITSVVGHHLYHECRTTEDIRKRGTELLSSKIDQAERTGKWVSSGGPWKL